MIARTPLGRAGTPEDIGAMVVHLARPESRWVTGQVIAVDGGMTVQPMADLTAISNAIYGAGSRARGTRAQVAELTMRYEVVTAEAPLGEGPVWCPDGTLVISLISPGALARIQPASGKLEKLVSLPGGANSAQLADDGGFVVTNNGGIDFTMFADALGLDAAKIPYRPGPPGSSASRPAAA